MPYANNRGVRIHYRVVGEGPPLVLLQGLGLSSRFWLTAPERLAPYFRVILPDNRGTGRSDCPSGPFSIRQMARDTIAVTRDAGLDDFFMAGISMGGMIAQEVALQIDPRRLRGLLLMATTCGFPRGRIPPLSSLLRLALLARRTPDNVRRMRGFLVAEGSLERRPDLFQGFDQLMREDRTPPSVFLRQFMAASFHNSGRRLHRVRCPTLVVTGDQDRLILPQNSEILSRLIPNARLRVIPNAGHIFPLEQPEAFDSMFREFMEMSGLAVPRVTAAQG